MFCVSVTFVSFYIRISRDNRNAKYFCTILNLFMTISMMPQDIQRFEKVCIHELLHFFWFFKSLQTYMKHMIILLKIYLLDCQLLAGRAAKVLDRSFTDMSAKWEMKITSNHVLCTYVYFLSMPWLMLKLFAIFAILFTDRVDRMNPK